MVPQSNYYTWKICYQDIEREIIFQKCNLYLQNIMLDMIEEYRNEQIKKILRNEDY